MHIDNAPKPDDADPTLVVQTAFCHVCGKSSTIRLEGRDQVDGFYRWHAGEKIQRALPMLDADTRELLMTGTHPACWDLLFADDTEGEE